MNTVDTYVDAGYQNWRRDRPELQRMISDGKVRQFDVIVVWKADRLVGSAATCGYIEELIDCGIDLLGVVGPVDNHLILFSAQFNLNALNVLPH